MSYQKRGRQDGDDPLPEVGPPLRGRRRLVVLAVIVLAAALVLLGVALAVVSALTGSHPGDVAV